MTPRVKCLTNRGARSNASLSQLNCSRAGRRRPSLPGRWIRSRLKLLQTAPSARASELSQKRTRTRRMLVRPSRRLATSKSLEFLAFSLCRATSTSLTSRRTRLHNRNLKCCIISTSLRTKQTSMREQVRTAMSAPVSIRGRRHSIRLLFLLPFSR